LESSDPQWFSVSCVWHTPKSEIHPYNDFTLLTHLKGCIYNAHINRASFQETKHLTVHFLTC